MMFYDPDVLPNVEKWIESSEQERLDLIEKYHVQAKIEMPSIKGHAVIHAVVETQIAIGFEPSVRAISRLQTEGLDRHEAIHAIGYIVADFLYELTTIDESQDSQEINSRMSAAIERLTAKQWFQAFGKGKEK
jgi:hypothetical protein